MFSLPLYRLRYWIRFRRPLQIGRYTAGIALREAISRSLRQTCSRTCTNSQHCPSQRRTCPYGALWDPPPSEKMPNSFRNPPRPLVLRPRLLDGRAMRRGDEAPVDVHLFSADPESVGPITAAVFEAVLDGIGPEWAWAEVVRVEQLGIHGEPLHHVFQDETLHLPPPPPLLDLEQSPGPPVTRLQIEFLSPTQWKGDAAPADTISLSRLITRAHERIASLVRFYGPAPYPTAPPAPPLPVIGETLQIIHLTHVSVYDVSHQTGRPFPVGGLVGVVEYRADDLRPYLPWLAAAEKCGIGQHTVWGNGEIRVTC